MLAWLEKFAPLPSIFKALAEAARLTKQDILHQWDEGEWWYLASAYASGAREAKKKWGAREAKRVRTMECVVWKDVYAEANIRPPYWHYKDPNSEEDPHAHGAHVCLTEVRCNVGRKGGGITLICPPSICALPSLPPFLPASLPRATARILVEINTTPAL